MGSAAAADGPGGILARLGLSALESLWKQGRSFVPRLPGLVGQPATSALSVPSESSASFPGAELLAGWRRNARCFPNIPRLADQTWAGVTVAVPSRAAAPVGCRGVGALGVPRGFWGSVAGWKQRSSLWGERPLAAGRACRNRGDARAEPW